MVNPQSVICSVGGSYRPTTGIFRVKYSPAGDPACPACELIVSMRTGSAVRLPQQPAATSVPAWVDPSHGYFQGRTLNCT